MDTARTELPLSVRRDRLLRRSAALRIEIGGGLTGLRRPLAAVDQVRDACVWLRRNPQWPAVAVAVVVAIRPRRTWRWIGRGIWAWRMWRLLEPLARASGATGSRR
jgi:YqjK-like protein